MVAEKFAQGLELFRTLNAVWYTGMLYEYDGCMRALPLSGTASLGPEGPEHANRVTEILQTL